MKKMVLAFVLALVLGTVGAVMVTSVDARADEITFKVKSNYKYKVQIEFYSQTRNHVWPGNGQAYGLNDYDTHSYKLACNSGEKICFGAWPTGKSSPYWGVGPDNKYSCSACCFICGEGEPDLQVLDP